MPAIEIARFVDLSASTLHDILALRAEVFVVEQACAYLDIDGRDTAADTLHLFVRDDELGTVASYLRVLCESDGTRKIGRVVTAPGARRRGLAAALITEALTQSAPGPVVIDAQAQLEQWYAGFGFVVDGEPFLEDDIRHVPMRRVNAAATDADASEADAVSADGV